MSASNKDLVSSLYISVYNRAPEASGLNYWTQELDFGHKTFAQLADDFITHPVFDQTYGGGSNEDMVNQFYQNVLGYAGDAAGVQYWTERLDQGETVGAVLAEFLSASLDTDLNAMDLTPEENHYAVMRQDTLKNKVAVSNHYADTLKNHTELAEHTNPGSLEVQYDPNYKHAQQLIAGVDHTSQSVEIAKSDVIVSAFSLIDFTPLFEENYAVMGVSDAEVRHLDNLGEALVLRMFNDQRFDALANPGGETKSFDFSDYLDGLNQIIQAPALVKSVDYLLGQVDLNHLRLTGLNEFRVDQGLLSVGMESANGESNHFVIDLVGDNPQFGGLDFFI